MNRTLEPSPSGSIVVCADPMPMADALARFGGAISDLVYRRASTASPEDMQRWRQIAVELGWIQDTTQKGR